jgi:hypothetical protein
MKFLLVIRVDLNTTDQLLTEYSTFIKYQRKRGSTLEQYIIILYIDLNKHTVRLEGQHCTIFSFNSLYP